ncbi:hypothetical protein EVAR_85377_1 [Eumeta japonica]|uniref:Uncharacterized protein n=1 Tax=Eumeta variegata TaxID=151549 RepID=A0A4C1WVJ0_EUMVA|nr:hypothetical protein EVAR_85377_1 [Eumeta japonica]
MPEPSKTVSRIIRFGKAVGARAPIRLVDAPKSIRRTAFGSSPFLGRAYPGGPRATRLKTISGPDVKTSCRPAPGRRLDVRVLYNYSIVVVREGRLCTVRTVLVRFELIARSTPTVLRLLEETLTRTRTTQNVGQGDGFEDESAARQSPQHVARGAAHEQAQTSEHTRNNERDDEITTVSTLRVGRVLCSKMLSAKRINKNKPRPAGAHLLDNQIVRAHSQNFLNSNRCVDCSCLLFYASLAIRYANINDVDAIRVHCERRFALRCSVEEVGMTSFRARTNSSRMNDFLSNMRHNSISARRDASVRSNRPSARLIDYCRVTFNPFEPRIGSQHIPIAPESSESSCLLPRRSDSNIYS